MNKVILVGRLAKDPEPMKSGLKLVVVTNRREKDQETGEYVDKGTFHNVRYFGKGVEKLGAIMWKGANVAVEGEYIQDKYTKDDGTTAYFHYVLSFQLEFLSATASKIHDVAKNENISARRPFPKKPDQPSEDLPSEDLPF